MANWELLRQVADNIKPDNFDMRVFSKRTECGTVACVAGHTVWIAKPDKFQRYIITGNKGSPSILALAEDELELTNEESSELFYGDGYNNRFNYDDGNDSMKLISKNRDLVPNALRWMADNQIIDWYLASEAVGFIKEK